MKIVRMGEALAIEIPTDVAATLGLSEGDDVDVRALEHGVIGLVAGATMRERAIARLASLRGWMPADYRFDRDEANAR